MNSLLDLDVITTAGIRELCEGGGLRVIAQTDDVLIAETPVFGVPHVLRRFVFQHRDGTWKGSYLLRRGMNLHEPRAMRVPFSDLLEIGLWIGGSLSCPVDASEVAAILGRRMS